MAKRKGCAHEMGEKKETKAMEKAERKATKKKPATKKKK